MIRLSIYVIFLLVLQACFALDYQRQLECEYTLNYIIKLVEENRIDEFHDS
jgi:hypothetical protein